MNPFLAQLVACARVAIGGAVVAGSARNLVSALPGGAGTGIYTCTIQNGGVDLLNALVMVTPETPDVYPSIAYTSDIVTTVTWRTAAPAAADAAFAFAIWRV